MVDSIRYGLALVLLVTGPGAVMFWFPIHPFARFWRRVGYRWGYAAGWGAYAATAVILAVCRKPLLSIDFGASAVTAALGVVMLALTLELRRRWRRHLTLRTLLGLPELAPDRVPGKLLTDGIYAWVRHPRYLEVFLGCLGWALLSNYLAAYLTAAFLLLSFLVLIPIEERELADRFGAPYEEYRRRVPAMIPRSLRPRG